MANTRKDRLGKRKPEGVCVPLKIARRIAVLREQLENRRKEWLLRKWLKWKTRMERKSN